MKSHEFIEENQNIESSRSYTEASRLGPLFKKHGAYDGKIFHVKDKVTYTFIGNEEVISLHFDAARRAIFYKGHNIDNLSLEAAQKEHLEKFRQILVRTAELKSFLSAYNEVFNLYLQKTR